MLQYTKSTSNASYLTPEAIPVLWLVDNNKKYQIEVKNDEDH